jgi:anti-anti-sigma factor
LEKSKDHISEERIGEVLVLKIVYTSISAANTLTMKEYILAKIEEGETKILLDLSNLGYMDSSFLGALVLSLKKATSKGGTIKLVINEEKTLSAQCSRIPRCLKCLIPILMWNQL